MKKKEHIKVTPSIFACNEWVAEDYGSCVCPYKNGEFVQDLETVEKTKLKEVVR